MTETIRVLKIHPEWLAKILDGEKEIEVKRQNHNAFDQIIGLGNTKTKMVEGYCRITASQEISLESFKTPEMMNRTLVHPKLIDEYANGRDTLWSWLLRFVQKEPNPYPYLPSCGPWGRAILPKQIEDSLKLDPTLQRPALKFALDSMLGGLSPKFAELRRMNNEASAKAWREKRYNENREAWEAFM